MVCGLLLGIRVQGLGFRFYFSGHFGFRAWGLGLGVGVEGLGLHELDFGLGGSQSRARGRVSGLDMLEFAQNIRFPCLGEREAVLY